ncbi:hypothetical protein [Roseovarius nitratireducens]|uniref:hypothetical protein n=1 Tax=Roseovarius nitratireducens TaxID=2044597 RepID=UPI000CE28A0A|nr:hypothetical protein [Roseovarius nitratireducens]
MPDSCAVSGSIRDIGFQPEEGAIVRFTLLGAKAVRQSNSLVVPDFVEATTDANGDFTESLIPNSYIVEIITPSGGSSAPLNITVPDAETAILAQIVDLPPPASLNAAEQAVVDAQAARDAASASATAAVTSETNAATSEANAGTSETNAGASAQLAADWAEKGDGQDVDGVGTRSAKHHAGQSATSASNAAISETNAANSAAAAATSETNAGASESAATASAGAASTSETNAANSASAASTSETNAANSASAAVTSETNAANSASAAAGSASAAASSETNAATSETNAAASLTSILSRHLGTYVDDQAADTAHPTATDGAFYYNSTTDSLRLRSSGAWTEAVLDANGFLAASNNLGDLGDVPTAKTNLSLGTAADADVPAAGDATAAQVVKGNDTRLSDARAPTAHTHDLSDITDAGTAASQDSTAFATATQGTKADSAQQPPIEGAFVDGDKTKLDHISVTQAVDLDAMETRVNQLDASVVLSGTWDASIGTFPGGGAAQRGESWIVSVGGTVGGETFVANDRIVATSDNASTTLYADWHKLDYTDAVLSVAGKTGAVSLVKADIGDFSDADYATAAQGAKADSALQPGEAVEKTAATGSAALPVGTQAQRDTTPAAGYLRFNSEAGAFEGHDGSDWGAIGGSASSVNITGATTVYVDQQETYTITDYSAFATYAVGAASGTVTINGDTITYTAPATDGSETLTVTKDGVAVDFAVTIAPAGVEAPTHVSPADGATDIGGTQTLQSSAFSWIGLSDTHASSDWQLATDAAFTNLVTSTTADATNLTTWEVTGLSESQTYYWRVRHTGTSNGTSDWSTPTSFTTAASFGGLIGVAGDQGFGVGEYPDTLPAGFSNMAGNTDPANANYGNYQYSDGSIMVFVPRFYYRIGDAGSPNYGTYGANAIDIAGVDTFADEASANAAGYAMHRAFVDGGAVKHGFFVDKYLCSQNAGNDAGKSVQNGVPISLTTSTSYTRSDGMTGCTGILADAVVLSRARAAGMNAASAFIYSALWLLSVAHGQAATAATNCAWYDGTDTTNYPKGCNSALADVDDGTVTFTTAGDSGSADKPLTGSASNLAKTAHNGQACGVADLNGAMWEVMLGITAPGANATDSTQIASGDVYVLKESAALGDLTSGYNTINDAWGDATHLGGLYDSEVGLMVWGATTGWQYLGSGTNQVLDGATSGQGYQRTATGLPMATNSYDATGTNLWGLDGQYAYNRSNLFPLVGGTWANGSAAGVGARFWYSYRSYDSTVVGFRAAAYGS